MKKTNSSFSKPLGRLGLLVLSLATAKVAFADRILPVNCDRDDYSLASGLSATVSGQFAVTGFSNPQHTAATATSVAGVTIVLYYNGYVQATQVVPMTAQLFLQGFQGEPMQGVLTTTYANPQITLQYSGQAAPPPPPGYPPQSQLTAVTIGDPNYPSATYFTHCTGGWY